MSHLGQVYKGLTPEVFSPTGEGGLPPDRFPLDEIHVYRRTDPDHWHYVGFGLSELDDKVSDVKELSGWGITADERDACRNWSGASFLGLVSKRNPLLVAEPDRASLLEDEAIRDAVAEGIERDGSSLGGATVDFLRCVPSAGSHQPPLLIQLSGAAVGPLLNLLRGRTRHGREACLASRDQRLYIDAGETPGWRLEDGDTVLVLSPELCAALLEDLEPTEGDFSWPMAPWLSLSVVSPGRAAQE